MVSPRLLKMLAVALFCFATGCESRPAAPPAKQTHTDHGHHHHDHGPNGGELFAFESYQAEVLFEDKTDTITIFCLDAGGKPVKAAADTATITVQADGEDVQEHKLVPADEDDAHLATSFSIQDKPLLTRLKVLRSGGLDSQLHLEIGEKAHSVPIKYIAHGHHHH